MKILAEVICIRNASVDEMRLAKNNDPNSDFLDCTFSVYKDTKLKGVDKHICMITVLGDPGTCFFDSGFSNFNEKKLLFSCTTPFFMKRPIKEGVCNREDHSCIHYYTPQLCHCAELANRGQNKPYVPFIQVNEESLWENFDPSDLVSSNPNKKLIARNAVGASAHMMCEENKAKIVQNLENVAKKLPSGRVFMICGKK